MPHERLLSAYLDSVVNQLDEDALSKQEEEEATAQQTWETEGGRPSGTD
jgi:hypothetical protein